MALLGMGSPDTCDRQMDEGKAVTPVGTALGVPSYGFSPWGRWRHCEVEK